MAFEKDPNEIGALWSKSGAKGEYLTGTIDMGDGPVKVVCFSVKKTSDKSPTWRVLRSVPRESVPVEQPVAQLDAEDIPF